MKYKELQYEELKSYDLPFLVVTATETETQSLHEKMEGICNGEIIKTQVKSNVYYIGKFGEYNIVHVQCTKMGAASAGGSILTVTTALTDWTGIKIALMVGICFGIDDKKQQIGDLLVSDSMIQYGPRRVSSDAEIPRGIPIVSNRTLYALFQSLIHCWEHRIDHESVPYKVNIDCCHLLSGEELIDNKERRDELVKENPTVKGGEMEGHGFGVACNEKNIPWIVVKAICDYADGQKGVNKSVRQKNAANSAVSCCHEALSSKTAFTSFIVPQNQLSSTLKRSEVADILFDIYSPDKESYYIPREIDNSISSILSQKGVWIFGNSGVGKTTSLMRNLSIEHKEFLLINMATCVTASLDEFFKEIYLEICSHCKLSINTELKTYQEYIKGIVSILDSQYPNKEIFIYIEEIPLDSGDLFREFIQVFNSLIIITQGKTANIKFILSSINSPVPCIPTYQEKVKYNIQFLEMTQWSESECKSLIAMLSKELAISIDSEIISELIEESNFLPRHIKMMMQNAIIHKCTAINASNINKITRL